MEATTSERLLQVEDLRVAFPTDNGLAQCVRGVSLEVNRGEVLAVVGESGSGKSLTAKAIMRLIDPPGEVESKVLSFDAGDLLGLNPEELRKVRGTRIGMVFQDPMNSLNPVFTVGSQIVQVVRAHQQIDKAAARKRAAELLRLVGIPNPVEQLDRYPHELSGGMRQRAMIAMAISCDPELLIADEPTTALDVTIQAQILELLDQMRRQLGMAVIMISHDIGAVARLADRLVVMYAGKVVEQGAMKDVVSSPAHPYTRALLAAIPRLGPGGEDRLTAIEGAPPEATAIPAGCPFAPRCEMAIDLCRDAEPDLIEVGEGHMAACCRLEPEDGR